METPTTPTIQGPACFSFSPVPSERASRNVTPTPGSPAPSRAAGTQSHNAVDSLATPQPSGTKKNVFHFSFPVAPNGPVTRSTSRTLPSSVPTPTEDDSGISSSDSNSSVATNGITSNNQSSASSLKEEPNHSPPSQHATPNPVKATTSAVISTNAAIPPPEVGVPVEFKKKKKKKRKIRSVQFEDKYELTGVVLGHGASSVVKECKSRSDGQTYAVKIVDKTSHRSNREQVFNEVDMMKECEGHANILQLISFFETPQEFLLVFEKVEGGELLQHIQERKHFTEREASRVIRDIANALCFLHERGIAHRDLKPQNILCVNKDQASPAKLCDFNLGSGTEHRSTTPPLVTPVGTPEFMAPEVVEAYTAGEQRTYDKRCDIWSLGVILYIMLCGHPPFFADCGTDCGWKHGGTCEMCADMLLDSIQDGHFDFPPEHWSHVSGAAKDLIARMLVRESQRLTAKEILAHPWVRQQAPATPLPTPVLLRRSQNVDGLGTFASAANEKNRLIDAGPSFQLADISQAALTRRRQSKKRMVAASFQTVQAHNIEDINTPVFRLSKGDI
eukprot:m.10840 g.10840  ORF g.10840 m.10840 type:complete len:561 (+) comp7501_c0_seq1:521-2203(+)